MKMKIPYLILLLLMVPLRAAASKPVKVSGEFRYIGTENQTISECKRLALEAARLDALAREFGTKITQDIVQQEIVSTSGEASLFDSRSHTSVNGEWIADEGEPQFKVEMSSDGSPIVYCKVKGTARELTNDTVEFLAQPLRNGSPDENFRSGDKMTLRFRSPVDGYVAVFLIDNKGTAYTLLPYLANTSGTVAVEKGKDYVFFDPLRAYKGSDEIDEMILMTDEPIERNILQVLFSPKPFTRPNDSGNGEETPRSLSQYDFNRWLNSCKSNDSRFSSQTFNLVIKK